MVASPMTLINDSTGGIPFSGLDNAGKTTVVNALKQGDVDAIAPTLGFNIETLEHRGYLLNLWDVGGQTVIRPYWRNYFEKTDAIVWVVDSSDGLRLDVCREELHKILQEERLVGASLLVLANKADLGGALPAEAIVRALQLDVMTHSHNWALFWTSAKTSLGLREGFDWLVKDVAIRTRFACDHQNRYFARLQKPHHSRNSGGPASNKGSESSVDARDCKAVRGGEAVLRHGLVSARSGAKGLDGFGKVVWDSKAAWDWDWDWDCEAVCKAACDSRSVGRRNVYGVDCYGKAVWDREAIWDRRCQVVCRTVCKEVWGRGGVGGTKGVNCCGKAVWDCKGA